MQTTKLTWVYVLLGAVLIALVANLWYMLGPRFRGDGFVQLKADSVLQAQIDRIEQGYEKMWAKQKHEDSLRAANTQEVKNYYVTNRYESRETISEPMSEYRNLETEKFLDEFYDKKAREVGLDPSAPLRVDTLRLFTRTEKQVKGEELLINDYKLRGKVIEKQDENIASYQRSEVLHYAEKDSLRLQLALKDTQIKIMENTKVPIVNSRKWYIDAAIIGSSLGVGFTVGAIYQSLRR